MDISEARAAIFAANSNLSPQEAEDRAQRLLAHEATQAALAELTAAVEEQQRADTERRNQQRARMLGETPDEGPSSAELLSQLEDMQQRGEGW